MFTALAALSVSLPLLPKDPAALRLLSERDARAFVPKVAAYYEKTRDEGAISVLALLLATTLVRHMEKDPELTPSLLWEWLRDGARTGLQNPMIRVRNRLIDRYWAREAYQRALRGLTLSFQVLSEVPPDEPPDPFLRRRCRAIWQQLSDKERVTAWLVWVEGFTQKAAAEKLGVTARTVRKRLTKILKKVS